MTSVTASAAARRLSRPAASAWAPALRPPCEDRARSGSAVAWLSSSSSAASSPTSELRGRILDAAVGHVPSLGWSEDALAMGAKDAGVSPAAHGQLARGAVDLVEHVASSCADDLHAEMNERALELRQCEGGWRARLQLAIEARLRLSLPYREHRAQALGLMCTPYDEAAFPPEIAALPALGRVADELARATLVEGEPPLDQNRWLLRRSAAAATYALAEIRALSDTSVDLADTVAFSQHIVDHFGDALEKPEMLKDGLRAGARAAASLAGSEKGDFF